MKIIEPSAHIIEDELAGLSVYQRIDRCASVCYQRPPRSTEEEAKAFCRRMVDVRHGVTLEMAVVHLWIESESMIPESRFILNSSLGWGKGFIVSGSIRAFMESPGEYGSHVWNLLAEKYPEFFTESDPPKSQYVRFAMPEEIPWQHKHVAVRVITNRAISHQIVRHRPCSILQESQRYCRYDGERFDGEVTFIRPLWIDEGNYNFDELFEYSSAVAEGHYKVLLKRGLTPQQARCVLPNDCKTELIMYASLPEWQHIFNLRCSTHADPEMRRIMIPLREEFKQQHPEVEW